MAKSDDQTVAYVVAGQGGQYASASSSCWSRDDKKFIIKLLSMLSPVMTPMPTRGVTYQYSNPASTDKFCRWWWLRCPPEASAWKWRWSCSVRGWSWRRQIEWQRNLKREGKTRWQPNLKDGSGSVIVSDTHDTDVLVIRRREADGQILLYRDARRHLTQDDNVI